VKFIKVNGVVPQEESFPKCVRDQDPNEGPKSDAIDATDLTSSRGRTIQELLHICVGAEAEEPCVKCAWIFD